ncbi:MAG: bifunctional diguanylate cyclase/phosphodiesterase [Aliiglaciecola sp.]
MINRLGQRFNSIQARILALFLLIIVVILAITVFVVKNGTYDHSVRQALIHSDTSARTTAEKLVNQGTLLQTALFDLTGNFSVKQLIASAKEDTASLASAMENFQSRYEADIYFVFDNQSQVLTQSADAPLPMDPQQIYQERIAFVDINQQVYLLAAAPMKFVKTSRRIDGWIVMGMSVDNIINQRLFDITQVHISLAKLAESSKVLASTFEKNLFEQIPLKKLAASEDLQEISFNSKLYFYSIQPLFEDSPYHLVLMTPEDLAFISYNTLIYDIIILMLGSAVLALLSAAILSKIIAGPIYKLVKAADHIRQGEYVTDFPHCSTNEVNSLSVAISEMQSGIQERENQINQLAFFDRLTGLPNRNQFNKTLEDVFSRESAPKAMIALIDIDRFKEINDTVGHETGDKLLTLISERMQYHANEKDLYARIGGDEFAVIFDHPDPKRATFVAEQLVNLFEQPFVIDNLVLDVDVSVGIAHAPEHAKTAEQLIQCADIALYSCKGTHTTYAVFEPSLNKYSLQRLNLMSELKEALIRGELELHYQPKIAVDTNKVDTVECLIRWIHPEHGFIPPDEFIGLAEQTGAIRYVTQWVLREALSQSQKWQAQGIQVGVAVNISAVDLADLRLPGIVSQLLTEYDVDPSLLTLEITESAIMGDPKAAINSLNSLRRMGIYLSIDDFGTGFSSMAQLKKMPVHELKIDKAFVLDLADNNDDKVMVKTLVALATNLGLTTVAEGVENQQSLDYLAEIGCTKGQGFFMSRPLPIDKFDEWFAQYTSNNN